MLKQIYSVAKRIHMERFTICINTKANLYRKCFQHSFEVKNQIGKLKKTLIV